MGDRTLSAVRRAPFRTRLLGILLTFALVPALIVVVLAAWSANRTIPLVTSTRAWDRVAASGDALMTASTLADSARRAGQPSAALDAAARAALTRHSAELGASVEQARRLGFLAPRTMRLVLLGSVVVLVLLLVIASRVAGHLSRQLSRPLDELVGWTRRVTAGDALPAASHGRGAPEFDVLRVGMRTMERELAEERARALAAERRVARGEAFRESARQVAHELKNPLTPIRFAVARLLHAAPPGLDEVVDVLATETGRLETMARDFAQFGRLPDGPAAPVDVPELVRHVARAWIPNGVSLRLQLPERVPMVMGHAEALERTLANLVTNAVDAAGPSAVIEIAVAVERNAEVLIAVRDDGPGVDPELWSRVFDPYVTTKPAGTGLGLAIARQTVEAHDGTIAVGRATLGGAEFLMRLPAMPSGSTQDLNREVGQ
jgi:signal transduction histidine kinase